MHGSRSHGIAYTTVIFLIARCLREWLLLLDLYNPELLDSQRSRVLKRTDKDSSLFSMPAVPITAKVKLTMEFAHSPVCVWVHHDTGREIMLISTASTPTLEPTQLPIQWLPAGSFPVGKLAGT
jgi:hypothetical protein